MFTPEGVSSKHPDDREVSPFETVGGVKGGGLSVAGCWGTPREVVTWVAGALFGFSHWMHGG